jgi:uncharacterized membrane protein YdjX (TVP38/TMEM64 family)
MRGITFWLVILAGILIPFILFERDFNALGATLANGNFPKWIAALLIAGLLASDIVLPVPSSIVGTAAGAILGWVGGAMTGWLGMMGGSLLGYWLGMRAGHGAARRFLGERDLELMTRASHRFGDGVIVLFRAVPVLSEASVFFAGLTHMPFSRFCLLAATSNLGISLVYAATGAWFVQTQSFLIAFAAAVALPCMATLVVRSLKK